jgi:hypothetical protein
MRTRTSRPSTKRRPFRIRGPLPRERASSSWSPGGASAPPSRGSAGSRAWARQARLHRPLPPRSLAIPGKRAYATAQSRCDDLYCHPTRAVAFCRSITPHPSLTSEARRLTPRRASSMREAPALVAGAGGDVDLALSNLMRGGVASKGVNRPSLYSLQVSRLA